VRSVSSSVLLRLCLISASTIGSHAAATVLKRTPNTQVDLVVDLSLYQEVYSVKLVEVSISESK
jgi:hypothetical protein